MHCNFRNNANSKNKSVHNIQLQQVSVVWLNFRASSPAKRTFIYSTSILIEYWDNMRLKCGWEQQCVLMWQIWLCYHLSWCRYSFCVPPKLDLHVRPKLGEREVTFCHVTEWIEKKLQDEFQVKKKKKNSSYYECCCPLLSFPSLTVMSCFFLFQKVFVLPNMDDIYLPLMHSGVDSPQASQHLSSRSQQSQSSSTESIERIPPEISGAESD